MDQAEKAISDTALPLRLGERFSCHKDAKLQAVENTHSTLG
jgi:hypothetical protein